MDESQESSATTTTNAHNPPSRESGSAPQCNGVPECRTLLRMSESHGLQLLGVLRSFRERGLMFDFTIHVQTQTFPCHRCVLAACSDFFKYLSIYQSLSLSVYPSIYLHPPYLQLSYLPSYPPTHLPSNLSTCLTTSYPPSLLPTYLVTY